MFSALRKKLTATRFEFTIAISVLQPWPSGSNPIAIGWQRGRRRRGATKSVYLTPIAGKDVSMAKFYEKFDLPVTLYKAGGSSSSSNPLGPFKKKCLILAVLETDSTNQHVTALGRVLLDLSEFAAIDGQEVRTFMVACNKAVHAAAGNPQLTITIRCRYKRSGAALTNDDVMSMSTDTTGSQMTNNVSSLLRLRQKHGSDKPSNPEQDLKGFEHAPQLETITEDDPAPSKGAQKPLSSKPITPDGYDADGFLRDSDTEDQTSQSPATSLQGAHPPTPSTVASNKTMSAAPAGTVVISDPNGVVAAQALARAQRKATLQVSPSDMKSELLMCAAAEVAVHLAGIAPTSKDPSRTVHAPSRRIARTILCLGTDQGLRFGRYVMRLIDSHVRAAAGSDLSALAFWFTNCVQLRGMMQAASRDTTRASPWCNTFIPHLLQLETLIFNDVCALIWERAFLPVIHAAPPKVKSAPSAAGTQRLQQETAAKRWLEAFDSLSSRIKSLGHKGHIGVLKQAVFRNILRKADVLLLLYLVNEGTPLAEIMADYPVDGIAWGTPGYPLPLMDDGNLPFARGVMTFGSGMTLKMTVTRFQQWAVSEAVTSALYGRGAVPADHSSGVFGLLRGVADLLMMPKDLLGDSGIRNSTCPALSHRTIMHIASRYTEDEYAQDPVSPAVIDSLAQELDSDPVLSMPRVHVPSTYKPLTSDAIMTKVLASQEPGIEYDEMSEDELEAFGSATDDDVSSGANRFVLLHQLWASGARRA